MSSLVSFKDVFLEFGDQKILTGASMSIEPDERVCLIGRNGAGKSTLINIINDELVPDEGEVHTRAHLRVSKLQQALPSESNETVFDYIKGGLANLKQLIDTYNTRIEADKQDLRELQDLQHRIEEGGGWNINNQVERILTEMQLPGEKSISELSGGWRRRATLGKALISQPELLLLDEPTNHLDLSAIQWLEDKIYNFQGSILFVTHDRAFMQRLGTRTLELDRAKLRSWPGSYHKYLKDKERLEEEEQKQNALFDKKLEQEETWIRQGLKARRTRNEGRVRALKKMRDEYSQRLKPQQQVRIHIEEGELSGKKIVELYNIDFSYGDHKVIDRLSLKIQRGDRIGLIGNNGVGKSTLIKIILGEITPQSGTVKLGTNLQIASFDQLRKKLDPEKTVAQIVGDGSDYIKLHGKERHVIGYLKGFLFSPKRAMTRAGVLSGGECNRILLAKLFTQPSNLLILDEPTNDLDVETLEVLEDKLGEYNGTLIVVSHDREFLDNVISSTLVFESGNRIVANAGGYSDWLRQGKALQLDEASLKRSKSDKADIEQKRKPTKLSYKLQRELDQLPGQLEVLEKEISDLHQITSDAGFYDKDYEEVKAVMNTLADKEQQLHSLTERWAELEEMQLELVRSET
ncbi:MAG: ATP-binding cassette domain-containing protein [Gammaproteobacteria bacterium]|nr:ATP-binding cassette domain-containing protein [Gammaproteobacteria bacterium]